MPKHRSHGSGSNSNSNSNSGSSVEAAPAPRSSAPVVANFASLHLTIGCGVAIFHVASEKVVLCFHSRDRYWFLPKGRKDAGEDLARAAEREGFEESGYRNRLLPLPIQHRQPRPAHAAPQPVHGDGSSDVGSATTASAPPHLNSLLFSTEPVWTQLVPQSAHTQYILFWYVAETVPPDVEAALQQQQQQQQQQSTSSSSSTASTQTPPHPPPPSQAPYIPPPPYPPSLSLRDRLAAEPPDYVPPRHEGTGVDAEEALYESYLVPVDEAVGRLRGSVMADVVRKGWVGIKERREWEGKAE